MNEQAIPIWFVGLLCRTPFKAFERWRKRACVGVCSYLAVLLAGGAWLALARTAPPNQHLFGPDDLMARGAVSVALVLFFAVPCVAARFLVPCRRLTRFDGRCLNCGESRESDFLTACSACRADFRLQDAYRRQMRATRPRNGQYAGLCKPVPELAQLRRRLIGWGASSTVLVGSALVFVALESPYRLLSSRHRSPTLIEVSVMILVLAALLGMGRSHAVYSSRRSRLNARRLRGHCLDCEQPVEAGDDICSSCGSSLLRQLFSRDPRGCRGLMRPAQSLRGYRRRLLAWTVVVCLGSLVVIVGAIVMAPESFNGAAPGFAAPAVAVGAVGVGLTVAIAPWHWYGLRRMRANLKRLAGRCHECEQPIAPEAHECPGCGRGYVLQQTRAEWFLRGESCCFA